ncbi:MAG: sel1 repeat family protein [Pseudoxanthomonas sp.]
MPRKPVPREIMTETFMDAHPDLRWRGIALAAYHEGKFANALRDFKRAATYADKFSQSMVANMYWNGQGTAVDRALGYAWMDLAAERGYSDFVQQREIYWSALGNDERKDSIQRGQAIYAEYRDRVAKPRMEKELDKVKRTITGSRTGFVSSGLEIHKKYATGEEVVIPATVYYDRNYYEPDLYWCTQDAYWSRSLTPNVDVGQIEQLRDSAPPATAEPDN